MATRSKSGGKVIHYHHDTKKVHDQLMMGSTYKTSKGTGVYGGRSWSNGKLKFISADKSNIYFTLKEWNDGGNSVKPVEAVIVKGMEATKNAKIVEKLEMASRGLIPDKTMLHDSERKGEHGDVIYLGGDPQYGIKVKYIISDATFYFPIAIFNRRFDIYDSSNMKIR